MKHMFLKIIPAITVVLTDQISKLAVLKNIDLHDSIPVIDGFFHLVHMHNRGMAFGIMNQAEISWKFYLLLCATFVAVGVICYWLWTIKDEGRIFISCISLILGGAIGNLIDRVRLHEVVDFLDFTFWGYHWPAFNIADSAISVGVFIIVIIMIFQKGPEKENDES